MMDVELKVLLQAVISGLLTGGVYALIGVGLNLIFGVMKIINFSHGSLMMLGMYTTYWLFAFFKIDPYVSLLISVPVLFLIGALIQKTLIRPIMDYSENNQLVVTMGIMLLLENLALFLWSPDFRTVKVSYVGTVLPIMGLRISLLRLVAFAGGLLLALILYLFLKKTDLGKAIRASSEEKEGASVVGISVKKIHLVSFGIGTACVGAAGTLITPFFYLSPHVGRLFLLTAFMVVVMGGMGSFIGAIVGGFVIGLTESVGAVILPGSLGQIIPFSLFILILLFRPTGLFK
jgi:branched-chain amino acid transport system permease protein